MPNKFADKLANVAAYRADIYTLMGVGRKKTAQFPRKIMFADFGSKKAEICAQLETIRPLTLTSATSSSSSTETEERVKFRRPHLLAVLPTVNIQRTIVDSMIQHALLHHSGLDNDTIFRYGDTNLLTFLSCGTLAQYSCSSNPALHFLSHQHRRHSALFDKLFELKLLHVREPDGIPVGHPNTSFHPQLPVQKKVTHEKKLAEANLKNGVQYAVQIAPRNSLSIDGKEVTSENGLGRNLLAFGCFMTQIGRQPNAKSVTNVISTLWPESALSIPEDILTSDKIGELPTAHLEAIFSFVSDELSATPIAKSYCTDLKIKRVV
ncbi:unnamed protein product [Caenorhabditis sp. 36 PRJEB53466]|nr:unnamed protein product [Caenorhabditis sp. 36 PRJEB53466]